MTVSNGDVIQAVVDFITSGGNHFQNKFTWMAEFGEDRTDVQVVSAIVSWAGDFYDEMAAEILPDIDDPDVYVDKVEWETDHWEVTEEIGEGIAGTTFTNGSESLPHQCAACLVGKTDRPRSRGRKFMPPFGEDRQAGGVFIGATLTALAAALVEYLAPVSVFGVDTLEPGVASKVTGTFLPFVAGLVTDYARTQRRRTPGYGV